MTDETPKSFYKYYDVKGAIATLCYETRRWTKPSAFNDPFDCQFVPPIKNSDGKMIPTQLQSNKDYIYKFFNKENSSDLIKNIKSSHNVLENSFFNKMPLELKNIFSDIQNQYRKNPKKFKFFKLKEKIILFMENQPDLRNAINNSANSPEIMTKYSEALEEAKNDYNKNTYILCFSKVYNSILMWSHYAESHKGALIEFLPQAKTLIEVKKVEYERMYPEIPHILDCESNEEYGSNFVNCISLTKSKCWKYEKEWRAIKYIYNNPNNYIDLPFDRHEVAAIYLGCRIEYERKKEIIIIAKEKYPHAKIYQARTHESEYSLVFDEIL